MKIHRILLSSLFALVCWAASAQQQDMQTEEIDVFQPHWYVQLQPVGVQYTLGENTFGSLTSYNLQLGGAYNFSPVFGTRLSLNGFQSKGGYDLNNSDYIWKWKYINPALDLSVNLSNLFGGFNVERRFSFGVLAGVGANFSFSNDQAKDIRSMLSEKNLRNIWDGNKVFMTGRVGLSADYRINDRFSVGAELQANIINDKYNSKDAGNSDWYFNALIGVKMNLGKTHAKKTISKPIPPCNCPETTPAPAKEEPVVAQEPVEADTAEAIVLEPIQRDVFFRFNSKEVSNKSELSKVKDIAYYLIQHPETKVTITGYADKETGSVEFNDIISEARAKAVSEILINQYGIDSSRIQTFYKGSSEQPYDTKEKNRVAICIAQ